MSKVPSWYVVATFAPRTDDRGTVSFPRSVKTHAKSMGTNVTACGLMTYSWPKQFDLVFPLLGADNCEECIAFAAPRMLERTSARDTNAERLALSRTIPPSLPLQQHPER